MPMKLVGGDWILAMDTDDRDAAIEALRFAMLTILAEIEGAGTEDNMSEHKRHYRVLTKIAKTLSSE
jgi:hypothetical protein